MTDRPDTDTLVETVREGLLTGWRGSTPALSALSDLADRARAAERAMDAAEKSLEVGDTAADGWHDSITDRDRLARRVAGLEAARAERETLIARQLTPLDVAIEHVRILRRKADEYTAKERDNVLSVVETHAVEARSALFGALAGDGGGATRVTSGPRHALSGHRAGCWRLRGSEWECNCDRIEPEWAGDGGGA